MLDCETFAATDAATAAPATPAPLEPLQLGSATVALATGLAACGGGGGEEPDDPGGGAPPAPPTSAEASRFLAQASMGANRDAIARVQAIGYEAWLDEQMAMPASPTRWDALVAGGYDDIALRNFEAGFDAVVWAKLFASADTLRQRVTLALSEIFVVAIDGLAGGGWKSFGAANYLDLLEAHAFGSHRTLLQAISTNPAMGSFLTFRGSRKGDPATGALPDENYARELMQLLTIGLVELNADGSARTDAAGATIATYTQDDITGLARVFTGWDFDLQGQDAVTATQTPDYVRRPLVNYASRYETGAKTFLGTTIAAGVDAPSALAQALDAICGHANVAPFLSRQLIQRLVTSNPSPAYVGRVAAVFGNDGSGVRGNLQAVVKAVLLDSEARSASVAAGASAGKLREPMLRFVAWGRAWNVASASGVWVGNTSDPATRLGQSPLRSPSVFNFFRPGYVPPNTAIATASLVAPEFQITHESSVVGAVNYLQRAVSGGAGDLVADYASLLAFGDDATALVDEINVVLAAGQIGTATAATIVAALQTMPGGSDTARRQRIHAALVLVVAAPEFVVLK